MADKNGVEKKDGAGGGGSQENNAGETEVVQLDSTMLEGIAASVMDLMMPKMVESMKETVGGMIGKGSDFRLSISEEITGAIVAKSKESKAQGKTDNKSDEKDVLNMPVDLGNGQKSTVAELLQERNAQTEAATEREKTDSARKKREIELAVKESLNKQGVLQEFSKACTADIMTSDFEIDDDLNIVAKKVKVSNPIPGKADFEKDLSVDELIDVYVKANPHFVGTKIKKGTGPGANGQFKKGSIDLSKITNPVQLLEAARG